MKLVRFGEMGAEKPGVILPGGRMKDLSSAFIDWNHEFFRGGGLSELEEILRADDGLPDVPAGARLGSCVARPGKVVCIGLNYRDHAEEAGMEIPDEPVVFMKGSNTVVGPNDPILIPRGSSKLDWEVELGFVIAKDASYLESAARAADYIAGYCICNDVSARDFQLERAGQWTKGKSCDTFNPTGPFLATKDEIEDVRNLDLCLDVNGKRMQTGNTKTMLFDVFYVVHYLSGFMTLEAGDLVITGTPPGVGLGMKSPTWLKEGDVVELRITGLGEQRSVVAKA
jgi:2-keto-4-pentenoate hydratase/2-oxohepta-3-ene-1,7-dioic acid hydratase in catechol pathway